MILAVTGLERERRMIAGPGIEALAGGGDHGRLEAMLDRLAVDMAGIISIGIAGGLAPGLRPGSWVVADAVREAGEARPTDRCWTNRLVVSLPRAARGMILGADVMAATAEQKAELHRTTGALAIDMESHVAVRIARKHRLPFAAARVIADTARTTLPPAARVGMRLDGRMDLSAVLRSLISVPWQLPALIRTGLEAEQAFRALLRGHRRLGPGLGGPGPGGPDVGKLPLDMV